MTSQFHTMFGAFCGIVGPIVGSELAVAVTDAVPVVLPSGISQLIQPGGALVGLVIALRWMTSRLDKAETKYEARQLIMDADNKERQHERDVLLQKLTELNTQTRDVIYQNSMTLKEFQEGTRDCPLKPKLILTPNKIT